jgi:uncharacterized repeat protein (TIGR03943 family)
VSGEHQAALMGMVAALLLRLGLTDDHLLFVKPAMRPWLVVAGGVLVVLALTRLLAARSAGVADEHSDAGHGPHGGGWLPWLMAIPFAAVVVVPLAPLGSYMAMRQAPRTPPPPESSVEGFPPLAPPVDGARELTLMEFSSRALYDTERHMEGETVRLTGFVTPASGRHDDFLLTRMVLSCCAGDGAPVQVAVRGLDQPAPAADTWLVVEGTWLPHPRGREPDVPALQATTTRPIPRPTDPYEH